MIKIILKSVVLFIFFFSTLVISQNTRNPEVVKILGISVEGNVTTDAGGIILASGLKQGDEISLPGQETITAIKQLWSRRIFSDIKIVQESRINDGVYLLIRVTEFPRMGAIEIEGNDEIKTDKIKEKIPVVTGQVITPVDQQDIERQLKKLYEEDGYLLAQVGVQLQPPDSIRNRSNLKIIINEGKAVQVENISFIGNNEFTSSNLAGQMDDTEAKKWWKFWKSAKFDKKKYIDDKKKIVEFYRKNGYRDIEITGDTTWVDSTKENMYIQIKLEEGSKYYIRNISWEGNTKYSDTILAERLGIQKGTLYNAERLERNLKQNEQQTDVSSLYQDIGYLAFRIIPEEVPVSADSLDINFKIYEGNQFRVGFVNLKGNTKTKDKVIRRELYTYPGDIFRRNALMESMRRLQQLNYFNPESIKPDVLPVNDSTVDLSYEVQEKSSDQLNAQVGYSGYYGFVGSVGFTFNNFSLEEPLSGGSGQVLDFSWQFGQGNRYRVFSLGFTEPWLYNTPTLVGFSFSDTKYNYTVEQQTTGFTLRVGRRFRWPDDYFSGNWALSYRLFDIINDPYNYYGMTGEFAQCGFTQIITRNSKDSPIFPTMGSEIVFTLDYYGKPIFPGTSNYVKGDLSLDWLTPLLKVGSFNRLVLYLHSEFGVLEELKTGTFIDYYETYRMGGGGLTVATIPLRGYEDGLIGPKTASSTYSSGKVKSKYVAELRYSISLDPIPIHALIFAEAGNVWKDLAHTEPFNLYRSAGVGVRLLINPIGLIGFDYGYGFDNPEYVPGKGKASGWKFHFQFGKGL